MKNNFTLPYMIGGILTMAAMINSSTAANNNDQPTDNAADSTGFKKEIVVSAPDTAFVQEVKPYAVEAYAHKKDVIYVLNTGDTIRRSGGTLAWRNNNPGNIVFGKFTIENGAIGHGADQYAAFPDRETGRAALTALMRTEKYSKLTLTQAIARYADKSAHARYVKHLTKSTGLSIHTKIGSLNPQQLDCLVSAICVIEGWNEGKTEFRPAKGSALAMDAAKLQLLKSSTQHTL